MTIYTGNIPEMDAAADWVSQWATNIEFRGESLYDAADMRAAFRHGYDFARHQRPMDERLKAHSDYSIDLSRIIEDLCHGNDIREPQTTAHFHFDMAVAYRTAQKGMQPALWQRKHPVAGWQKVEPEDIEHYKAQGQEIRPLYAMP